MTKESLDSYLDLSVEDIEMEDASSFISAPRRGSGSTFSGCCMR